MSEIVVVCRGIARTYQDDAVPVHALRGIDVEIARGDFVTLAGPSGSGKSTLLNIIGGLDRPDEGDVVVDGVELNALSQTALSDLRLNRMGFVFQSYNLIPVLSARENVEFIMQLQGVSSAERAERARSSLRALGIGELEDRRPGELSGGQQQRAAIARALVTKPSILLADEPTGNLDSKTGEDILQLFDEMNQEGLTVMVVTHDQAVSNRCDRIIHLIDGMIDRDTTDAQSK